MSPLTIALIGMVAVIGGVLALRLHAFLALILGAFVVSALTGREQVLQHAFRSAAWKVVDVDAGGARLRLEAAHGGALVDGSTFLFRGDALGDLRDAPVIEIKNGRADQDDRRFRAAEYSGSVAPQTGDLLIHSTQVVAAGDLSRGNVGNLVAAGFGDTCAQLGILVAMASILGKCLLDSGAAERIVVAAQRLCGEKRTPLAFLGSGFALGIPVFFDTVFYLLLPLGKAMHARTGKHYVLYVLTIVAGATMAHSLVPPTPGPLFVAGQLGVDIGVMMLAGVLVGLCTASFGYGYACWADRRWAIPLRPSVDLTAKELTAMAHRDAAALPSLGASLAPILLAVVPLAAGSILSRVYAAAGVKPAWLEGVLTLSNKNLALGSAALAALILLISRVGLKQAAPAVQAALSSGGVVLLITGAGGAFGAALRQTGIAESLGALAPTSGSALVWLPIAFSLTALVRIAQGSATVAMITAVGIVAPIAVGANLGFHPVYLALAVGCGSKPIPWMNDSGFWIIATMSGFTEGETLKTASVMMTLMGIVGLVVTLAAALVFPLA